MKNSQNKLKSVYVPLSPKDQSVNNYVKSFRKSLKDQEWAELKLPLFEEGSEDYQYFQGVVDLEKKRQEKLKEIIFSLL